MNERDKKKKNCIRREKVHEFTCKWDNKKNKTPREAHDPKDHELSLAKSFYQQ